MAGLHGTIRKWDLEIEHFQFLLDELRIRLKQTRAVER